MLRFGISIWDREEKSDRRFQEIENSIVTSRISTNLSGQTALVTGAARGLGRCIAQSLAAAGAKVACIDVNAESLADTVAAIRAAGGTAEPIACDVTDGGRVGQVVDEVVKLWGRLDILVNNAGITRDNVVVRMKDEQWDAVLNINLRGTFLFTRAAARPMMKGRRGRIVNIASVSGLMGNPGQVNYSASKAGVIGLTRTVARELAGRNITVNAVAPGFIATDMTAEFGRRRSSRRYARRCRWAGWGTPRMWRMRSFSWPAMRPPILPATC